MGFFDDVFSGIGSFLKVVKDTYDKAVVYQQQVNQSVQNLINDVASTSAARENLLNGTIIGNVINSVAGALNVYLGSTTNYEEKFLSDTTPIVVAHNQDLTHTPTVAQFLQASAAVNVPNALPASLTPFLYNGKQLAISDAVTGMAAKVWSTPQNQIIIAYQGTAGQGATDVVHAVNQVLQDVQVVAHRTTLGQQNAVKFAQFVAHEAEARGYNTSNIFVTGHSLGGIEAEYVAQQTGLAGIGFDSTGILPSTTGKGDGSNFINILQYGDPVSSYASDIQGAQPFAPDYDPNGGIQPHYGKIIMTGDVKNQQDLSVISQGWNNFFEFGKVLTASNYLLSGFPKFHAFSRLYEDLNVTPDLSQYKIDSNGQIITNPSTDYGIYNITVNDIFNAGKDPSKIQGVVHDYGNNSIAQIISAQAQRTDYHATVLPSVTNLPSVANSGVFAAQPAFA
ncbi:hypothetical protein [Entomobacter blattae]|uniref:Uncharacterized protein n=1 Tax=Entomobacter blattae TaxID=2762277 RepID=A0A7H1NR96_9PROT|nr:hypothetical protein [Entomobacter blattae]QNT78306.1 hypothetical protein JGUZn3_10780 [Entomobacter blattae]